MSNQIFNGRVDLLASTATLDPTEFIIEANVFDGTGQFGAEAVQANDVLFLDTYIVWSTYFLISSSPFVAITITTPFLAFTS